MPGLEQGRVFSGREALNHKLIDQIGGEAEAVKYLEEQRNVPKGLKIVDWKPEPGYVMELCTVGDACAGASHRHSGRSKRSPA